MNEMEQYELKKAIDLKTRRMCLLEIHSWWMSKLEVPQTTVSGFPAKETEKAVLFRNMAYQNWNEQVPVKEGDWVWIPKKAIKKIRNLTVYDYKGDIMHSFVNEDDAPFCHVSNSWYTIGGN